VLRCAVLGCNATHPGCSSVMFVVCCVGSGLCDKLIPHSEESYWVCVSNCV
jgi:hypothetical protein